MIDLYLYRIERRQAYSINGVGTFYQFELEELSPSYADAYTDEDRILICKCHAVGWNQGGVQFATGDSDEWYTGETIQKSVLTTKESAGFLGVSVRRVQALITNGQIPARKGGRDWLVTGPALIAFVQQERPAHRPKSKSERIPLE